MKTVSIIIPVYNIEKYIKKCLESLINQTYTELEIVVIDDGSIDNTITIVKEYSKRDKRIRVLEQKHKGVSAAKNYGLSICTGDYIAFVDGDDWIELDMIEKLVDCLEAFYVDISACNIRNAIIQDGDKIEYQRRYKWSKVKSEEVLTVDDFIDSVIIHSWILVNKLYKRELLDNKSLRTDLAFGEDSVFMVEILKDVKSGVAIPNYLGYNYLINRSGNVCSAPIDERSLDFLKSSQIGYYELEKMGHPDAAIVRILSTIREVLCKLPEDYNVKQEFKKYLDACKATVMTPGYKQLIKSLFSAHLSRKNRIELIANMINPRLTRWIIKRFF